MGKATKYQRANALRACLWKADFKLEQSPQHFLLQAFYWFKMLVCVWLNRTVYEDIVRQYDSGHYAMVIFYNVDIVWFKGFSCDCCFVLSGIFKNWRVHLSTCCSWE